MYNVIDRQTGLSTSILLSQTDNAEHFMTVLLPHIDKDAVVGGPVPTSKYAGLGRVSSHQLCYK